MREAIASPLRPRPVCHGDAWTEAQLIVTRSNPIVCSRRPIDEPGHIHEITFFDRPLWESFVTYMQRAKASGYSPLRIHWNVLPAEQRVAWTLSGPSVAVVATPDLLPPSPNIA